MEKQLENFQSKKTADQEEPLHLNVMNLLFDNMKEEIVNKLEEIFINEQQNPAE